LRAATTRLEQQLANEQAARLEAEKYAHAVQMKSDEEIMKLRKHLEQAHEELRLRSQNSSFKKLRRHFEQAQGELRRRVPEDSCAIL